MMLAAGLGGASSSTQPSLQLGSTGMPSGLSSTSPLSSEGKRFGTYFTDWEGWSRLGLGFSGPGNSGSGDSSQNQGNSQ